MDLVECRSAAAFAGWLGARTPEFRAQVQAVAMDGFTGYKNAATTEIPDAVTVMDPFHVVALVGAKLDTSHQRLQQQTLGRRGRSGDPLYQVYWRCAPADRMPFMMNPVSSTTNTPLAGSPSVSRT